MSNYSELIKNLKSVREYIKDFYIYGFKTRNDFTLKSQRTYDNEKRRIESWLGDLVKCNDTPRGRQVSISVDCGKIYTNPLHRAYQTKSFTNNDIMLHFYILDILKLDSELTSEEITNKICQDYSMVLDVQIVRLKLNEYVKEGIIIKEKRGKAYVYSLSPQPSFVDSQEFQMALKFYTMAYPFGEVGQYIQNQLGIENDTFFIKHNYIVHTLEDTILLPLVNSIDTHQSVEVVNFGRDRKERILRGVPLKIYVSTQTGRRYLIFFNLKDNRLKSLRLDFIRSVKPLEVVPNYEKYLEYLNSNAKYCWGISFGNFRKSGNVGYIKFSIKVDMPKEKYILNRLVNECRNGRVEKISENIYSCTIETFDVSETIPWVRTFIGRIVSIECSNQNVVNRFREDIRKMYLMYGGD